jgi:surfactin synthase thioesterase subunit
MNNNKIRLFCFPYAGGSATIYKKWSPYLASNIELVPVELAGRVTRIIDPLYANLDEAIADIYKFVKSKMDVPYAIFGHSMGAQLAYELGRNIMENGDRTPEHIFFSGRGVPNMKPVKEKKYHLLNDEQFKEKLLELGGTPKEFFQNPELLEIFLPLLRNDFKLASIYFPDRQAVEFPCDISVYVGKEEEIEASRILNWKRHTRGICTIALFNGGHFFINDHYQKISKMINNKLQ